VSPARQQVAGRRLQQVQPLAEQPLGAAAPATAPAAPAVNAEEALLLAGLPAALRPLLGRRRLLQLPDLAEQVGGAPPAAPTRTASGSIAAPRGPARVARASRIWVEGTHDAELVERVWGADLRELGVVVEPMGGIDELVDLVGAFGPGPSRRLVVLVDHLVPGAKEYRIAAEVERRWAPHVRVLGHPYVDVWQAVRPAALGIAAWPVVPPGQPWKAGVCAALGWPPDEAAAWRRILRSVRSYADLDPALLGRVEEAIDLVTAEA
jgi:hypothetical protein